MNNGAANTPGSTEEFGLVRAALDTLPYGYCLYDRAYRLVRWNDHFIVLLGLDGSRFYRGMPVEEVVRLSHEAGNYPGRSRADLDRTLANKSFFVNKTVEEDLLMRGRTLRRTRTPLDGEGWLVTYVDVTEDVARMELLRRSESEIKLQHSRLEGAFANIPHGLAMYDADYRLVAWNRRFCEIFGVPFEAMTQGMTLRQYLGLRYDHKPVAGQSREQFIEDRANEISGAPLARYRVKLPDGRTIQVTRDPTPEGGTIATHQDITEDLDRIERLHRSEEELKLQQGRLLATFENIPHGVAMYDEGHNLVVFNRRFCEIFGVPYERVEPGMGLRQFIELRIENDPTFSGDREAYIEERFRASVISRTKSYEVHLPNGRIIYITRDPTPEGGWVATHEDITEERRNQERIHHLARHDALTDLPNRVVLHEAVTTAETLIDRGVQMAMVCVDLDHFKSINDTQGHAAGDDVLKVVAERMRAVVRETDVVARLGGDEFAILMTAINRPRDAALLADRLIKTLSAPIEAAGHQVFVGASVGIALAPEDGREFDTLMKNADLALYRAKGEGRGTFHFFEPSMDAALQERRILEMGLRVALARGEFFLLYQPLFHLPTNRITGFEALLRWNHPERGVVSPASFISIAEESGLIVPIGEWILRNACAAAASWPDDVNIAVNLSPAQFKSRDLVQQVRAALSIAGVRPSRLDLEVTESLLLGDNEGTLRTLHELRRLGVRVSMDDFGTGYSSLSYLRSFPFDKIKIDRSFVKDLVTADESRAIVKAVIGLGRSLGIATTAEGVENEEQLDVIRDEGCTEVQGFLFSPPLPLGAASELARRTSKTPGEAAAVGRADRDQIAAWIGKSSA